MKPVNALPYLLTNLDPNRPKQERINQPGLIEKWALQKQFFELVRSLPLSFATPQRAFMLFIDFISYLIRRKKSSI